MSSSHFGEGSGGDQSLVFRQKSMLATEILGIGEETKGYYESSLSFQDEEEFMQMMKGLEGVGKNSDEKIVFDKMDTNCGDITIVVEDDAGDDGVENMEEDVQDDDPDLGAKMEDEGIVEIVIPLKAS